MVETCVGPSELHLKKELTALQKAHFLRDPETCSSWRSPVSSNSVIATSNLNSKTRIIGDLSGKTSDGVSLEMLNKGEAKSNKIYLHNWKHQSTRSIDDGVKLIEEDKQLSVMETSEDNLTNYHVLDPNSNAYPECLASINKVTGTNLDSLCRRTNRTSRQSSKARKGVDNHAAISKLLDIRSTSLAFVNSAEQSDDTENCNSEDLPQLKHALSRWTVHCSRSASPLFSDSGFGNLSYSSKISRMMRRQESSSCTPASTNSYHKFGTQNPSVVDSCDSTAASCDGVELDHPNLPNDQGCGMNCCWSKRTKYRGIGGLNSPSLSDTLKRKGSKILCGRKRSSGYSEPKRTSKCSQGLPLLTNSCDGGTYSDTTSDELSTNLGELDLEAVSRLDGTRWSTCKSQDALESTRLGESDLEIKDKSGLSHKYQPRSFNEIIGQNIVVHSLNNAILLGRISPAYLFHGPRGTGKTSVARIFSAALNCLSNEDKKPCWLCSECTAFSSKSRTTMHEVNSTSKKKLDKLRYLLENISLSRSTSHYKIFVFDDYHMMFQKIWSSFMKYLEEPLPRVVFIFCTTNMMNMPHSIISRCQKYLFSKVKDEGITCRLRNICEQEHLDAEPEAMNLIALNSGGSPRDAESMLDQLSLLGKTITTTLVNDLVGVVSDDKLLDLLEIAMSSDNAETVKRSRELLDSGVDPTALMAQLAGLIMDIIAGTYKLNNLQIHDTKLGKYSLTEAELDRLKQALKILSAAEKQLQHSNERSTWFTAALLRLGDRQSLERIQFSDNNNQSIRSSDGMISDMVYSSRFCKDRRSLDGAMIDTRHANEATSVKLYGYGSLDELDVTWRRCIDQCHSKTLKKLLNGHGKLVSITDNEGILVVLVSFEDDKIKTRAERFLSSITNSFEMVLKHNVEVRLDLLTKNNVEEIKTFSESPAGNSLQKDLSNKVELNTTSDLANKQRHKPCLPVNSSRYSDMLQAAEKSETHEVIAECRIPTIPMSFKEGKEESAQLCQRATADEQRLESAWLQAAEKYTPEFIGHSKPEKNQVLPQNGVICQNNIQSLIALDAASKTRIDELNHEINCLKVCDVGSSHKEQTGATNRCAFSPSVLHRENQDRESGPGCNRLLCWRTQKSNRQKSKQGVQVRLKKAGHLSLLGQCAKLNSAEHKSRK
ncbi:protein STICHEL-like isoform X1 [Zingiber officinale]|uniref:protein STICHEL-like isoform X1 n=1 Tax=Zingiber officinale TaxID=94328 RepID=UPI001C4AD8EE|nr:protein STICHEL-like isoform X1 [Zingiber officinale]